MNDNNNSQNNRSIELCRRVVTTESFIAEAKGIYGDRYDYNKVVYKNKDHRVTIVCSIHGDFQVYAREHPEIILKFYSLRMLYFERFATCLRLK